MKRLFYLLIMLTFNSLLITGQDFKCGSLHYTITSDHTVEVSPFKGNNSTLHGIIKIPTSVVNNGTTYQVTAIGNYAFLNCDRLTSVTIPNTVKVIGEHVFQNCSSMQSFYIPNSVTLIKNGAFLGCTRLSSIVIPNTVKEIGDHTFANCSSLTSITIPGSVTKIGHCAFSHCKTLVSISVAQSNRIYDSRNNCNAIIETSTSKLIAGCKKTVVPIGVTSIEGAFAGCSGLTSITIPNSVKEIGRDAFSGCEGLTSLIIPNSVTKIGIGAFSSCGLTSIFIPKSVKEINDWAFANCDGLCKAEFSSIENLCSLIFTHPDSNPLSYAHHLYIDGQEITELVIPETVIKIGDFAFKGCNYISSISIANSVAEIGSSAFYRCRGLSSVTLPSSIKTIKWGTFFDCTGLISVTITNSVVAIEENAFYGCSKLVSVRGIHNGISIDQDAFVDCPFSKEDYVNSFDNYAYILVSHKIKEWQLKGEFETTSQHQARVTKENQQRKIQELMQEAVKGYTKDHPLKVELGNYDADHEVYILNSNYGKKYVKIPLSDAPAFKDSFRDASFSATYYPTEEGLQINDLSINLNGKTYHAEQTATDITATAINIDLPEVEIPLGNKPQQNVVQIPVTIDKSIDQDIPLGITGNSKTFAVIIGNEKYTQVAQVPYANNDAKIFAEYCKKTLGLPDKNVKLYENATYGTMIGAVSDIQKIAKAFKGDISLIFYYAGHGIPDETTGDGYLLPIDANGLNMRVCYSLSQLYKDFGDMQARNITCFMDACFSGAQRGNGMVVAARGVAIKAKSDRPTGNTIVFTATTDKQTAYPYDEKGHGMFTYYLLKKLRDTKGDCTLGELGSYICEEVAQQAAVTNGKEQTPIVLTSIGASESWKNMKLK